MTIVTIIHSAGLKAREPHVREMCASFSSCGATVAIVMGPEPPMQDPALLSTLVNFDPNKLTGRCTVFRSFLCDLKVRNLSNALKHVAAIQHIASAPGQSGQSWHIIVEDDSMIDDVSRLISACESAPEDADMLFFGLPTPLPHVLNQLRYDELLDVKLLPACDCYAVRMQTARFLSTMILPIRFKTEVHLSWLIASTSVKTYLTSPNLSVDGSKVGVFVSSIESNNRLSFNAEYNALQAEPDETGMDMDVFQSRVRSMPFGSHPDAQVLLGTRLGRAGHHELAKAEFESALNIYRSEGAVMGQDSDFLRVYMDLFRHDQEI